MVVVSCGRGSEDAAGQAVMVVLVVQIRGGVAEGVVAEVVVVVVMVVVVVAAATAARTGVVPSAVAVAMVVNTGSWRDRRNTYASGSRGGGSGTG